tara:strand:- start:7 stop:294 length:288 start_codon:yes stop_codon:yes gene_type:complete
MKKSKREQLAEGIMDKLIQSFYTKKHEFLMKKLGGIDPDLKKQAEVVKKATDELKKKILSYKKFEQDFYKKNNISTDSKGNPDVDQLVKTWKKKI